MVNQPHAGVSARVQVFGEELRPLDDLWLVARMNVDLEEKGNAKFSGQQKRCERRTSIRALFGANDAARDIAAHLPHKAEIGVLENLLVVHELDVVAPD